MVFILIFPLSAIAAAPSVSTDAEAAALIDVSSGRILYSNNGDKRLRIASLTKIMTAIVAIEAGSLSDKVKVSLKAYGVEGSSIYLRLGEEMNLHHMLYGLMLRSGNDAATAIAEHVGGSLEGFVMMMNEKAEQLGMSHTHYENPHGLDTKVKGTEQYSSANDMAILTAYALQNPIFRDIVKTPSITVPNSYEKWDHRWRNKNKMLHLYEGADGVKTGFTKLSNRTLVSSATRGGQQLAAVTLNDGNDWADHAKLLDYGFKNYPLQVIQPSGRPLKGTTFVSPIAFSYPLSEDERLTVDVKFIQQNSLSGRLGIRATAYYHLGDTLIGKQLFYNENDPIIKKIMSSKVRTILQVSRDDVLIRDDAFTIMKRLFRALFTTADQ
ncbi:MAG: D-alanyl-D-alanine carboxypeptidase family protein [Paenibacillaceae bacterium]